MLLCKAKVGSIKTEGCYECDPEDGITTSDFLEWHDELFGPGDIACLDGIPVLCGKTSHKCATIVSKFSDDRIIICNKKVQQRALKVASRECEEKCNRILIDSGLQFSFKSLNLGDRYIPVSNDRVVFVGMELSGIGVVKEVRKEEDLVDFFCYYINETDKVGYSMNELGITTLSGFIYERMNENLSQEIKGNRVYLQRKLNKALSRHGKVWNEKLHRIEPIDMQVPSGHRYWYFNDRMETCSDIEKGTAVSKFRKARGNYFGNPEACLSFVGKISEMICDRLASDDCDLGVKETAKKTAQ